MSEETIINKLSDGMIVKIKHYQSVQKKVSFETGNSSTKRTDHYQFITESNGKQKTTNIPKRLYVALRAFEIDPKFKGDL